MPDDSNRLGQEEAGREVALRLLDISRVYDDVTARADTPWEWPVHVALTARQRRHMQAVIALADHMLFLEAEIIVRTMIEFAIQQRWLLLDAPLNRLLWVRDEINRRFTIDRETQAWARANDQEFEILRPEVRERLEAECTEIERQLDEIVAARGLDRRPSYPPLKERADATGDMVDYSLAYRTDSQSAAHPSVMALQNLIRALPGGDLQVQTEPTPGKRVNVYAVGAYQLLKVLSVTGDVISQLHVDGLEEILETIVQIGGRRQDAGEVP